MIHITGDTHGEYSEFLERLSAISPAPQDTVIICGDFGFVWGDEYHESLLGLLEMLPFTIAFADGNHENFDLLYACPVEEWNGGKIHRVRRNIVHLMRGQVFTIEGKTFYTFGGAYSIDKFLRRPGISWWEQELPTKEDYNAGADNLDRVDYKVDYVITHTIPTRFIHCLSFNPDPHDRELTGYLNWLYDQLSFRQWFAGHWHVNRSFDDGKFNLLYENVLNV